MPPVNTPEQPVSTPAAPEKNIAVEAPQPENAVEAAPAVAPRAETNPPVAVPLETPQSQPEAAAPAVPVQETKASAADSDPRMFFSNIVGIAKQDPYEATEALHAAAKTQGIESED